MDLVVCAPRHPTPGEKLIGGDFPIFPSDKGANQAVDANRLGAEVRLISRVGRDVLGDALLETVQWDGVDTTFLRHDDRSATGFNLITLYSAGQNAIIFSPKANIKLTPQDIQDFKAAFDGVELPLMRLECPLEAVQTAAQIAQLKGLRFVRNPASACPLPLEFLAQNDHLLPNKPKLCLTVDGETEFRAAPAQLVTNDTQNLVITPDEQGAIKVTTGTQEDLPAFALQAVDTLAAGYALAGAFRVDLVEGRSLQEVVTWGNAVGEIAVTRPGAQPSLPTREELMQFLEEHQI